MMIKVCDDKSINERLDVFIKNNSTFSRTYIEKLIEDGKVSIFSNIIYKPSYKMKKDDEVCLEEVEARPLDILPQNIKIDILYEDNDILIINKDRGMVVHPSNGHIDNTLVNAIMYHCKNLSTINGIIRPGIVHRIDKDTSGILCVCKNDFAHKNIAEQFKQHTNVRKYKAIVRGIIKENDGIIDKMIGRDKRNRMKMSCDVTVGKNAITKYKVIERFNNYTYIECTLLTGRTHQIRVHMKSIGHPLLGDLFYGSVDRNFKDLNGQILHAYYLELDSPTNGKRLIFQNDVPEYFNNILNELRKNEK